MSTIAINADELLNDGAWDNNKSELNDKTKAAMAAGVAGAAVGAGVKAAVDAYNNRRGDLPAEGEDEQEVNAAQASGASQPSAQAETVSVEVNPDDVMLEEPIAELAEEDQMIEEEPRMEESNEYSPFANNDIIEEVVYDGPLQEEILYAENLDDLLIDDSAVDLVCGLHDYTVESSDEPDCHVDDLQAWESDSFGESEIQSDLMA